MKPFWNDGVSKPLGERKGLNKLSMLWGFIYYCKITENVTNLSRIKSYQPCLWSIVKNTIMILKQTAQRQIKLDKRISEIR